MPHETEDNVNPTRRRAIASARRFEEYILENDLTNARRPTPTALIQSAAAKLPHAWDLETDEVGEDYPHQEIQCA